MSIRRLKYPLVVAVALAATPFLLAAAMGRSRTTTAAVACGDTVSASVTLTGDLSCGSGDGIDVGANNVVVNLNGHKITGGGSATGVDVLGHTGVTVENGIITQFDTGVGFTTGSNSGKVTGIHMSSLVSDGIIIQGSNSVLVTQNVVTNVSSGVGIEVDLGTSDRVTSNVAAEVTGPGIEVDGSTGVTITGNKSLNNSGIGIRTTGTTTGLISGNVADGNGQSGIRSDVTLGGYKDVVTLSKNRAAFNTTFGIIGAAPVTVDGGGNVVQDNGTAAQCQDIACIEVSN